MPQEKDQREDSARAPVRENENTMSDKEFEELLKHTRGGRPCDGCPD